MTSVIYNGETNTSRLSLNSYDMSKHDDGVREAETVAEFRPFSTEVDNVTIRENMKTLVLDSYSGDTDPMEHLL